MGDEIGLATPAQVQALVKWLGGGSPKFTLLYRASRDGWSSATFHELCDEKGPTLSIGKTPQGYICGGFCTLPWTVSGNYARDETAFVFSLSDGKDRPPKQCTQHANFSTAVYHLASRGPTFGGGVDLTFNVNKKLGRSFLGYTYLVPQDEDGFTFMAGPDADFRDFPLTEVEVYAVTI